jgi:protocatechuate 3,4-dioxygenase beta subunit
VPTDRKSPAVPGRRQALGALSALGTFALAACGGGDSTNPVSSPSLAGLSVSAGALAPGFSSDIVNYTLAVANTVSTITFTPTAVNSGAKITINGSSVVSGGTSAPVALFVGVTTIGITVVSADASTTRSYAIIVTRAGSGVSSDATLASLALSAGTLSPAFAAAITNYAVSVDNSVAAIAVTPVANSGAASITVNGVALASGATSDAITLNTGLNTLTIVVLAQDGATTLTYTVSVTRAVANASSDATLSGLLLSVGALSPAFGSGTLQYTAEVGFSVNSLALTAVTTNSAATLRLNGIPQSSGVMSYLLALNVGSNTFTLVVTAQDGITTLAYTVVVTRDAANVSSVATLSALALSAGSLAPAFVPGTANYTAAVDNSVATITATAFTTSSTATLRINGGTVASGIASPALALVVGSNTLSLVVTAQDGTTTQTYTVVVTRVAAGTCILTANETDGPYPLYAVLSNTALMRSDIRDGKTGVPLTLTFALQQSSANCAALSDAAIYLWQCDKDGLYSGYDSSANPGQAGLTYLRGVQVTNSAGQVSFTSIFPGWYAGRITHLHLQVYLHDNLTVTATATTQLAFPQAITTAVYNTALYTKGQNTSVTSFAGDSVFSDGTSTEMVAISGDPVAGYAATLTIVIA